MQILNTTFSFNRLRGSGPRTLRNEVVFTTPVTQAVAFLKGFDVGFSPRDDHHLGNLEIRVDATLDPLAPQRVFVDVVYGLRDWSGDWDDNYEGEVFVTVVGD
jgi:hypothetical protein